MKITGSIVNYTALYDFAVYGGAEGTINLGVFIPVNTVIWKGTIITVSTVVTDSGLSEISFGYTGAVDAFLPSTTYAQFVAGNVLAVDFPNSLPSSAGTVIIGTGVQITMTINMDYITSGKIAIALIGCQYATNLG